MRGMRLEHEQARDIARDLTMALIERLGVQSLKDTESRADVVRAAEVAVEMTRKILEAFKG